MAGANYSGQEDGAGYSPYDGKDIFTERMRKQSHEAFGTGKIPSTLLRSLISLANQQPYPSHQAAFILNSFRREGLLPDYDTVVSHVWSLEQEGDITSAQALLEQTGSGTRLLADS